MGREICYQIYEIKGLSLTDNSILFQLAFATSKDGNTVNIALENLAYRAKCNVRTVQRSLRKLEELGYIVPVGEKGGRGHVLRYALVIAKPVASSPVVQPEHIPPPTNGHKPELNGHKSPMQAARERIAAKSYDDPLARRDGESAMEYARRVDRR